MGETNTMFNISFLLTYKNLQTIKVFITSMFCQRLEEWGGGDLYILYNISMNLYDNYRLQLDSKLNSRIL